MTDQLDLPEPPTSGSTGTQERSSTPEIAVLKGEPAVAGLPLADAVQGLASTRARSFGGEVGAQLLAASVAQISYDLQCTRNDLRDARADLKQSNTDLSAERTLNATLRERVSGLSRSRHFSNGGIMIGTLIISIGFDFVRGATQRNIGLGLLLLGAVLIVLSWLASPKAGV